MNCDCITTEEKRISAGFFENKLDRPKKAGTLRSVTCANAGINFTSGKTVLMVGFNANFDGLKKPYPVNLIAAFCPFCGKAIDPQEPSDKDRMDWVEELYSTTNSTNHSPWTKFMELVCEKGFRKAIDIFRSTVK